MFNQPTIITTTPVKNSIGWVWWRMPVIPVTQEAEAGELPEPRRQRLRWAKIVPLHTSLGNKSETSSQKKKKKVQMWNDWMVPQRGILHNDSGNKSLASLLAKQVHWWQSNLMASIAVQGNEAPQDRIMEKAVAKSEPSFPNQTREVSKSQWIN